MKLLPKVQRAELSSEWPDFIDRWSWDWFTTNTFRDYVHPEAADKAWNRWLHKLNREIFGVRYTNRPGEGVIWVRGSEYQDRSVLRFHGLVGRVPDSVRRLDWMDEWDKLAGFARIYPYDPMKGARFYLSKYVLKGGQVDMGGPLIEPHQLFLELWSGCGDSTTKGGVPG